MSEKITGTILFRTPPKKPQQEPLNVKAVDQKHIRGSRFIDMGKLGDERQRPPGNRKIYPV